MQFNPNYRQNEGKIPVRHQADDIGNNMPDLHGVLLESDSDGSMVVQKVNSSYLWIIIYEMYSTSFINTTAEPTT